MIKKTVSAIGIATLCGVGAAAALPAAAAGLDSPGTVQIAACQPKQACNPCNPCAAKKACNPCNPCAAKKACSPCNPCNPCNPCAVKKN
jgi:hypothetical protein